VMDSPRSLSEHRVDPGTARCGIVWQHERIRALLDTARSIAGPSSDGAASPPRALASAIADIRSAMEAHFAYEERHWLPFLRAASPLGRERAEEILREHDQQRDFVSHLYGDAYGWPMAPGVVSRLTFLAAWLLSRMADEERGLVRPPLGDDDFFVIPQRFD
jgi:hypothetical protein